MTAARSIRRRAPGLAFVAALAAVLLGPVAGAVPVSEARAAATDLTLVGAATYTVLPEEGRVRVAVDFTVRNRLSESKTRRYYFDRAYIAVLPGTVAFRVSQWKGSTVKVTKRTSDYTMLRIDFGSRLYGGTAHPLRLTFDLPDPGRGANRQGRQHERGRDRAGTAEASCRQGLQHNCDSASVHVHMPFCRARPVMRPMAAFSQPHAASC